MHRIDAFARSGSGLRCDVRVGKIDIEEAILEDARGYGDVGAAVLVFLNRIRGFFRHHRFLSLELTIGETLPVFRGCVWILGLGLLLHGGGRCCRPTGNCMDNVLGALAKAELRGEEHRSGRAG